MNKKQGALVADGKTIETPSQGWLYCACVCPIPRPQYVTDCRVVPLCDMISIGPQYSMNVVRLQCCRPALDSFCALKTL